MKYNKDEIMKQNYPYWVTEFTFNDKEYSAVGSSKRYSLDLVLENADSDIRDFLN